MSPSLPLIFGRNYSDGKKRVNKVVFLSCGRQARLYHLMWRMVWSRCCTSLHEIFGFNKSKMKIWMKDVWYVKNKRPAVGSHFPFYSICRDNANHTNTQKSRRKSQPTLKAKSAQPPFLGCVDLLIFKAEADAIWKRIRMKDFWCLIKKRHAMVGRKGNQTLV